MTTDHEVAIRGAVDELVAALLAALRAEAAAAPAEPERLMSVTGAAVRLGISRATLYAEIGSGRLRTVKVGRRRLIPASAIDAYIAARGAGNGS